MKAWKLGGVFALALSTLVVGASTHLPVAAQTEVKWEASWDAARAAARQSGKPIFTIFR